MIDDEMEQYGDGNFYNDYEDGELVETTLDIIENKDRKSSKDRQAEMIAGIYDSIGSLNAHQKEILAKYIKAHEGD